MSRREAGPALDAEVAVLVMRCTPREETSYGYRTPDGNQYVTGKPIWSRYSTDLTAAFAVVEHLRKQGWLWTILVCGCDDDGYMATATATDGDGEHDYFATAATLPLAICEAALLAVAGKVSA